MYILELENKDNQSVHSDFIIDSFNQREVLHQGLKQSDDSVRLSVPFSADIWNFLNANKLIKAKITEDGASYFTGFVRPDFDFSKIQRFQPIQLELVNGTYIASFYEIESSIAYKDTTLGVIVSDLLERAKITGQDTSYLDEPIIFDIIEEGTTVKDSLSQILFEYGYFWDFDKNGEFTVQKIYNENVTPSVVLDGTNILEKVQVSKKEQEFDRVELEYEHYEKFENILIFQDNTGSGTNKGCFIELGPGKYLGQVEGETSYDITYDSDKGEVIWADNASLSILSNYKDKLQTTFINKNTKGNLSVYNTDLYKSNYILLLEVWGTAYVKTIESATIKVGQDGKNKSIKSKYIHSKAAAENFAKMYYDWGKSCDYVISLQSKLNLDVGTIVEVNTAGKIVGRVIEKTTKLDGKPYTYKIEAIKEYELPEITSSILRKSSPIGTAARGTGILKIDTAPDAYTTPVSGITPSYRISTDIVKTQSMVNDVYTGDILQYSYYQYQVILVADDYVYTAERTSIRGSVGATGATGAEGTRNFYADISRTWTNEEWNEYSTVGYTDIWSNQTIDGMRIGDTFVITATLSEKGNSKGQIFTQITSISPSSSIPYIYEITAKTVSSLIGERGETGPIGPKGDKGENGTSVKILGTKPSASDLPAKGEIGDSWLVNGNLYVWADNSWENVGNIQGPKGDKGDTGQTGATGKDATQYYIHYVYCDDTDLGTNYSTTDTRKYVGVYVDTTSADATSFAKVPNDVIWSQIEGDKGDTGAEGTKTFYTDISRAWTNAQWNEFSTVGYTDTWSNSTIDGMRIGDTFVITATLSEKGNITGQIFTQITSISGSNPYIYEITAKTVSSLIGEKGETGQRGGRDLAITTAPSAYTATVGGFTPSYRIALSTVKTQSGISTVYVGDTLVYGIYRYPVGYVDSSYVYTSARTSIKGDAGTKTFYSDYNDARSWTNAQWNEYSTTGYTGEWSNSTADGMRVGDILVIAATLSEKGYITGQIFTQIIKIVKNSSGVYEITSKTVSSLIGEKGASSRTIAFRINYSTFTAANDGEMYVCGYNSDGDQADIPGYVIVNGYIHYVKGMLNSNVPMNGYVVAEIGGTSASPKTPFFAFYDWGKEKYYKIENSQETSGKTWEQLFTEITNKSNYIVLGKVSNSHEEEPLTFEETTPCLLSSVTEGEENFVYQGVVATTTDMKTSITPYKFTQDAYGNWTKTALNTKTVKKWSFVLCMNAETPTSSTAAPVIKVFNGTWWYEISSLYSAYYSSLQSMMAGDLPAVAGYYDTLGLAIPSICGTYIKTLTSNKAFINELFANDITVGNKISTPFTPTTSLRCYVEYSKDGNSWTTDLSAVYNSSEAAGTQKYIIRFGHQLPNSSTRIPLESSFTCYERSTRASYAFSTVDDPYTIPGSFIIISNESFPDSRNINPTYKWLFIKETFKAEGSPIIYALPCYTTSTRSNGFEIKSDGSAIFTGKTRFEGGIGIISEAKDIVRNKNDRLFTISYHFPMDFKIYDVILFLEPNTPQGRTILLYKFTCFQYTNYGKPGMNVYTTYDGTSYHSTVIEASIEDDNVGYDSQQYPNGYIDAEHSLLQKVVIKQKTPSFPIASVKGVIIPYME